MAYDDDDIGRESKKQKQRKDAAPLSELSEAQKFALLEERIRLLLIKTDDRKYFEKEIKKLTARCGLRIEREQTENALRLFDQVQNQKRTSR